LAGTSYQTVREIDRGGMGTVLLAYHTELKRHFVVKLLRDLMLNVPGSVARALTEASAIAALDSPYVVSVTDCGTTKQAFGALPPGTPYFVMEYLKGQTVRELMKRHPRLPPVLAVQIAVHVLYGLSAAHQAGLIHRDVKPTNVFIHASAPGCFIAKLIDFGTVKVLPYSPVVAQHRTRDGQMVGTPEYASPEQLAAGPVDPRSDIYSVGQLLYFMLTGTRPFVEFGTKEYDVKQNSLPRKPSSRAPLDAVRALDPIVLRALDPRPEGRYQSAIEFAQELVRFLGGPPGWLDETLLESGSGVPAPPRSETDTEPGAAPISALRRASPLAAPPFSQKDDGFPQKDDGPPPPVPPAPPPLDDDEVTDPPESALRAVRNPGTEGSGRSLRARRASAARVSARPPPSLWVQGLVVLLVAVLAFLLGLLLPRLSSSSLQNAQQGGMVAHTHPSCP
jgi:serine/threonine-protein kinase